MTSSAIHTPTDAALAKLTAGLPGCVVFDAQVPSSTTANPLPHRYAVLYPRTPRRIAEDLARHSDLLWCEWQITSVASTRPEVEWIQTHARDALVDVVLEVTGLTFEPIAHLETQPMRPDDDVPGRLVLFGVDQYGCNATLT